MTRRALPCSIAYRAGRVASLHPRELDKVGVKSTGDIVTVESRRGKIYAPHCARGCEEGTPAGAVIHPVLLLQKAAAGWRCPTNPVLDLHGRIPEFKSTAR